MELPGHLTVAVDGDRVMLMDDHETQPVERLRAWPNSKRTWPYNHRQAITEAILLAEEVALAYNMHEDLLDELARRTNHVDGYCGAFECQVCALIRRAERRE